MKTKSEIFTDYKTAKIIESKKTVLKLDLIMFATVLTGAILISLTF